MTPVMPSLITWKDEYSVGIPILDSQHKHLITLINALNDAMKSGRGKDVLGEILAETVKYTKTHFLCEEQLMRMHSYPDLTAHLAEHQALTAKALDLQKSFATGAMTLSVGVMEFLSDWLRNNILGSDMKYSPFLRRKVAK